MCGILLWIEHMNESSAGFKEKGEEWNDTHHFFSQSSATQCTGCILVAYAMY
jgi:hypothetical protein